ncbi:hypothetical protein FF2_017053 [Malus domestica]
MHFQGQIPDYNHWACSLCYKTSRLTSISALTSPVKAPPFLTQQFCAATWKSSLNKLFPTGINTYGGLTTNSTTSCDGTCPLFSMLTIFFTSSKVPLHF